MDITTSEASRLAELASYEILDTAAEQAYDDITYLATRICDTPIALVSLVDYDRQWFKSRVGLDTIETDRDLAFCHHAIQHPSELMIVNDATSDERFATNPLVTADPNIRFYAGAPLTTASGNALGTLCVIDRVPRDISPEQQDALRALSRMVMAQLNLRIARDAAQAADQAKMQFLSSMSHEIRTPLNAILGLSQLMSAQTFGELGDPRYHEYVDDIHNAGSHLLSIIGDILDYSRISAKRLDLKEESVDLVETIRDAVRMVPNQSGDAKSEGAGATVELHASDDLPLLHADPRRVRQIVINVVGNAVKFSPADSQITVVVDVTDDRSVRLRVIDQGRGMSRGDIETALAAFGQVGDDGSSGRGTGLGLPITQRLIDAHGGSFQLESTRGEGTTASIVFPPARTIDRV